MRNYSKINLDIVCYGLEMIPVKVPERSFCLKKKTLELDMLKEYGALEIMPVYKETTVQLFNMNCRLLVYLW